MKNLRSILLALTVLLLATAAQAQTTRVQASIPFDFVVGDHAYSAGDCGWLRYGPRGVWRRVGTEQGGIFGMRRHGAESGSGWSDSRSHDSRPGVH